MVYIRWCLRSPSGGHCHYPAHSWLVWRWEDCVIHGVRRLNLPEYMDNAKTVTTFYITSLAGYVGPGYQPPNLPFLAQLWFKSSGMNLFLLLWTVSIQLRRASSILSSRVWCFGRKVIRRGSKRLCRPVAASTWVMWLLKLSSWNLQVPSLHTNEKESTSSPLALYLCGYLAIEKYSIMSTE